jgi:hypothetical protein
VLGRRGVWRLDPHPAPYRPLKSAHGVVLSPLTHLTHLTSLAAPRSSAGRLHLHRSSTQPHYHIDTTPGVPYLYTCIYVRRYLECSNSNQTPPRGRAHVTPPPHHHGKTPLGASPSPAVKVGTRVIAARPLPPSYPLPSLQEPKMSSTHPTNRPPCLSRRHNGAPPNETAEICSPRAPTWSDRAPPEPAPAPDFT